MMEEDGASRTRTGDLLADANHRQLARHRVRSLGECALTRSRDLSAKPTALMRDVGVLQNASAHLPEARSSLTRREALDEPAADRLVDCAAIRATGSDRGGSLPRSGRAVP